MATLRCLPPVQPTATVTYRLPSRAYPVAQQRQQPGVGVEELRRARLRDHVLADLRVAAGVRAELGDPVRVRQEPAVHHQVGVDRQAVLVAEAHHGGLQVGQLPGARTRSSILAAQLVHVQAGGVDDEVGLAAQLAQPLPLGGDAVHQAAGALQRVRAPDALEPPDQHLVGGLQEQHPHRHAAGAQASAMAERRSWLKARLRTSVTTAIRVDGAGGAPAEVDDRGEQRGRQVVDDEEAEVLQAAGGGAPAGAGQAGDHHDLRRRGDVRGGLGVGLGTHSGLLRSAAGRRAHDLTTRRRATSPVTGSNAGSAASAAGSASAARTASAVRSPTPGTSAISLDGRGAEPLQRAEVGEQRLAPGRAEPGDVVEHGARPSTSTASGGGR